MRDVPSLFFQDDFTLSRCARHLSARCLPAGGWGAGTAGKNGSRQSGLTTVMLRHMLLPACPVWRLFCPRGRFGEHGVSR